jgi:hypothetical protein
MKEFAFFAVLRAALAIGGTPVVGIMRQARKFTVKPGLNPGRNRPLLLWLARGSISYLGRLAAERPPPTLDPPSEREHWV